MDSYDASEVFDAHPVNFPGQGEGIGLVWHREGSVTRKVKPASKKNNRSAFP